MRMRAFTFYVAMVMGCGIDDAQALLGTWSPSNCHRSMTATADALSFTYVGTEDGRDTTCATPTYSSETKYSYVLGGLAADGADALDQIVTGYTLTPRTKEMVSYWNSIKNCGHNGWALDVATDVSGHWCRYSDYAETPAVGDVTYDIVLVGSETLHFGDDCATAGDPPRPTRIAGIPWVRQ